MRYLITISYDGTDFSGYQKQPKERTVQSELEKALKEINGGKKVDVHASGRTDAGVTILLVSFTSHMLIIPSFPFCGRYVHRSIFPHICLDSVHFLKNLFLLTFDGHADLLSHRIEILLAVPERSR